jgi:hypothetical protein
MILYDICETEISTIYSDDVEQYYATYVIIYFVFYYPDWAAIAQSV